jgi:preprotein translocase subunit YajC
MITEAFASSGTSNIGGIGGLIPFILVFAIFYLLLIRPQQKKMKEHDNMIKDLKVGDKVLTGGGIIGKIVNVNNDKNLVTVMISKDVEIEVLNHTITSVIKEEDAKNIEKKLKEDKNNKNKKHKK